MSPGATPGVAARTYEPRRRGRGEAPALAVHGLTKRFGEIAALSDADLEVFSGEIHAVLGENGAGKSTLMKLVYGYYRADAGSLLLDGVPRQIESPRDARRSGIGMVFQNFTLVPAFTVLENIALAGPERGPRLNRGALRDRIQALGDQYGLSVDPDARVRDLSVGERQRVEILKVLSISPEVLILDEPTSVLTPAEVQGLLDVLRRLRDDGYALILISHKLQEVFACADWVTVLRGGRVAGSGPPSDLDHDAVVRLMLGERAAQAAEIEVEPREHGAALIELDDVTVRSADGRLPLDGVSLAVHEGEITGIAAVAGNGQAELANAILGVAELEGGAIRLGGRDYTHASTADRLQQGLVAVIPEDPLEQGAVPSMSVGDNLLLTTRRIPGKGRFFLRSKRLRQEAEALAAAAPFEMPAPQRELAGLSGGNVQRVLTARELTEHARQIVAYYPSRGLDVASARSVQRLLVAARDRGSAVLLVSEDLDELLALSDRVLVMRSGQIVGGFDRGATDPIRIGGLMTGATGAGDETDDPPTEPAS